MDLTIQGPDGNPVNAAMVLKQDGDKVTGRIAAGRTAGWISRKEKSLATPSPGRSPATALPADP